MLPSEDKLGRCFGYPNWACNLLIKINPPIRAAQMSAIGKADICYCTADVRFRGQSGHDLLRCTCLLLTQSGHHPALTTFANPSPPLYLEETRDDGISC